MIAVDTNVVVRLLTGDDPARAARSAALFRAERVLVAKSVLLETEWVLRYSYGLGSAEIADALRRLLGLPDVSAEDPPATSLALELFEKGLDFADALHLSSSASADRFVTFDARFARRAATLAPIPVVLGSGL